MNNLVIAINALIALTELSGRLSAELARVAELIRVAQNEGRDLTDTEMAQVEAARIEAVAAWKRAGHKVD